MTNSSFHLINETLKQQIGQMVVVRASGHLFDQQIRFPTWEAPNAKLRHWLQTLNLGGVILLGGTGAELALRTKQLQQWSKTPLLVAADTEEGVGQRFSGATWFPPPMALGAIAKQDLGQAIEYATQMGVITAQEALAIGINWILAPIVDVNNNPENPVINIRSFSNDPEIVSHLATAFIDGAKTYNVLTTTKHFPGHGDTSTDSHLDLPVIPHKMCRLAEVELVPFKKAIEAGVDSVMTAHLLIRAWDEQKPATLSNKILTGQLREKLGFEGLIVTDALVMGGVTNYATSEEVAVMAVEAGADILLMPHDPEKTIEAVYQAVESGRITHERIEASLARIWHAKQKVSTTICSPESQLLSSLNQLSQPRAKQTVVHILQYSSEKGGNLPLKKKYKRRNLIVVDDILNCDFLDRQTPAVTIPKQMGYNLQLVDKNTLSFVLEDNRNTLLQIFVRGNPFRGNAGLTDRAQKIYKKLLKYKIVKGLIIYGSPYVKDWFLRETKVLKDDLPWVFSYGQMAKGQEISCKTLFGLSEVSCNSEDNFL
ncbi:MAG: glycoside hydrolase family 3 N-terminal domain-containing protein [cyanobacterium endosymbiont of Rhopalodia musculus]|uniref:glycoside hydrolase family 3 N-terminal domain-containing protein n=1 Tax=cyanobacterium endosymbiont of Epithemia clementina EcSB TaxID=3034674 RepID=UPI002480CF40|nr:glycoside hydrolase family 3 N-terminal domain-containing protein [cyanobacterium endosymbiont of Epithemia clementina EcSB]WGT67714.1 glycoside hydrolase family 3 N-terminal domain-containing protein [cyanobacterium endosymbiont of Epithemia clementina EcSB]